MTTIYDNKVIGELRSLYYKYFYAILLSSLYFLYEAAGLSALLGDDAIGMNALKEGI